MDREIYGIIRSVAIVALLTAALTACQTPREVGGASGKWGEDAGSWATAKISPATKGEVGYEATGYASWYGKKHHGRRTASGARFDMNAMTAAHRTLPFGTRVRVTNLDNGRSVTITVNDRGPYARKRLIDLSRRAAAQLGFLRKGIARVRIVAIGGARG